MENMLNKVSQRNLINPLPKLYLAQTEPTKD